jgi:hypothetical protein
MMIRGGHLVVLAVLASCSSKAREDHAAITAIASNSMAIRAPSEPASASAAPLPVKPGTRRPIDESDVLLLPGRRTRLEALAPESRGFLTSAELEEKLYSLNLRRGVDADALRAFDGMAKGRWILFTGNIGGLAKDGFELPIRYTPKDAKDALGLTSTWLGVKFTNVKGYDMAEYRQGDLAVILARYEGDKASKVGYDVVLLRRWFD